MAFSSAKLKKLGGQWTQGSKRGYSMVLLVEGNADSDKFDVIGALRATGVPKIWDSFDPDGQGTYGDDRSFLVSKSAASIENAANCFHVTCNFETLTREQKKKAQHPLARPAEISDGANVFAVSKHLDVNGDPILNGAKQLFSPANEVDEARGVVTITQNFPARLNKYLWMNRVNSDTFEGASPGQLRITNFQQDRHIEEYDAFGDGNPIEVEFWTLQIVIEHNPAGWQLSALNVGRKQLSGGILDNADVRDPPWPLTAGGAFIDEADLPGDANTIDADTYFEANYSSLGLDI